MRKYDSENRKIFSNRHACVAFVCKFIYDCLPLTGKFMDFIVVYYFHHHWWSVALFSRILERLRSDFV